jgi:signal transduction histidine kinase
MARKPDSKSSPRILGTTGAAVARNERMRLARELHDGLAQELAFIALQSRHLAEKNADPRAAELAESAQRALAETRDLIVSYSKQEIGPVRAALARTAERLARRWGAKVELDLDPRVEGRPETHQDLLKILQEAMSNGARHGNADEFAVKLSCESGVRLEVADNGTGFDPSRRRKHSSKSFGLASMGERANELGGQMNIHSHPGQGTAVEVLLP